MKLSPVKFERKELEKYLSTLENLFSLDYPRSQRFFNEFFDFNLELLEKYGTKSFFKQKHLFTFLMDIPAHIGYKQGLIFGDYLGTSLGFNNFLLTRAQNIWTGEKFPCQKIISFPFAPIQITNYESLD